MIKLITTTAMIAAFGLSQMAAAQDLPTAGKRMNINYVEVHLIKYKNGKGGEGNRIIREYFVPAAVKADITQPITLHMQTGPWDAVNFWNYETTMGNFDYFLDPDDEKFWAAMAELNGGITNARKIMADYQATIARQQRDIGHRHLPPSDD